MKEEIIIRDKCPICNSTCSKSIFKHNFNEKIIIEYMDIAYQANADIEFLKDKIYEIVKCDKCNFLYQKYVLNDDKLNELYNKWIDPKLALQWNESKHIEYKQYNNIFKLAKEQIKKDISEIKVLDYGAGFGDLLIIATKLGFDTYAYEYSSERIQFLRNKGIKVVEKNDNMLFDFIIINQVVEHLTYPDKVLKEIITKLDKNGIIYFNVPNCYNVEKRLMQTKNIINANELFKVLLEANVSAFQHINFFNNYNLKRLFKKNGLKIISPFKQAIIKPKSFKSIIRPFYVYFFRTDFYLKNDNY